MSDISKKIELIVAGGLAPLLKGSNFTKKARYFYRKHDDRIDVINLQSSQWNNASEGRFTVNVGLYYPAISVITNAPIVKGMPKVYDCTIQERIGHLTEGNLDHWWKIDSTTDDIKIASDLAKQVDQLCLPWLDRLSNLETTKQVLKKKKNSFIAAGIALHQGLQEDAQNLYYQALTEKPLARSRFISWAKQHGLKMSAP